MGEVRQLLLVLGKWQGNDLVRGPGVLQRAWRWTGQDYQRARKRLCPGARQESSPVIETDLDRTQVGLNCQGLLLVWFLRSRLQELGSKWTERECKRTMQQHVDWGYKPSSSKGIWVLEWPHLWSALKLGQWSCLQEATLVDKPASPAVWKPKEMRCGDGKCSLF